MVNDGLLVLSLQKKTTILIDDVLCSGVAKAVWRYNNDLKVKKKNKVTLETSM